MESTKDGTPLFDIAVSSNDFKAEHTVQAFLQIIGAHSSNVGLVRAAPANRFIDTNETRAGRAHNSFPRR